MNFIPVLPTLNSKVLLPGIVVRLVVERPADVEMLKSCNSFENLKLILVPLISFRNIGSKDPKSSPKSTRDPPSNSSSTTSSKELVSKKILASIPNHQSIEFTKNDLNSWGCLARVIEAKRQSYGSFVLLLEGQARFEISNISTKGDSLPYFLANGEIREPPEINTLDPETLEAIKEFRAVGRELVEALRKRVHPQLIRPLIQMLDSTNPSQIADLFASVCDLTYPQLIFVLNTLDIKQRILFVMEKMEKQIKTLSLSTEINSTVQQKIASKQREILLREQLEAIKKELGESDDQEENELQDLERKLEAIQYPSEIHRKTARKELSRLKRTSPNMSEHQVIRTYLEWIVDLPWDKKSNDVLDVEKARQVLDEDHYGMEKIKTRVLEYLSLRKLQKDAKGPILCFLGPPGVGKTSLGKSIASALNRSFYRISLGGVRDESEIRGHRRTYVGAMPGLLIQALKRTGVNNPVILLDEIDKLGGTHGLSQSRSGGGDPANALLEVLDPEQNATFTDHYLNLTFDLSQVLFIATANDVDGVPPALMDRMELVNLSGYTVREKLEIARKFLLPKQEKLHGLVKSSVQMTDKVLEMIIVGYTMESGVRSLERHIASICRSLAVEYSSSLDAQGRVFDGLVTADRVVSILGEVIYDPQERLQDESVGICTGLAYSSSGSGGLLFIEASITPISSTSSTRPQLILTGKLGQVIQESAQISLTWVKANLAYLCKPVDPSIFERNDIHIHFPAGATPKDGPSAGVSITTALVSLLTNTPVSPLIAMTGEISLRGKVMPIGGVKEKLLAAHRSGIKKVLVPFKNRKDVESQVEAVVRTDMEIVYCKTLIDVLNECGLALLPSIEARL